MKGLGRKTFFVLSICLFVASGCFAQNYKIRQTVSMNGQKSESTVYVKGARKRTEGGGFMGMGGDVADVEQCDLKRHVKISDKKKSYFIEPFDDGAEETALTAKPKTTAPKNTPTIKGGVVTMISSTIDTGERKQMFGMTARHIKTSMKMEASPDACMKEGMDMQSDGWYIDLPEFSCPVSRPSVPRMPVERGSKGSCQDRFVYKNSGSGKLGFALQETRTFGNGGMSFSQTTETLEFSKATLDAALFDVPQGYALASNADDLYGKPDMAAIMRGMGNDDEDSKPVKNMPTSSGMPKPKAAGKIRIGVYLPTNKNGENISTTNLQMFLAQKLTGGKIEAVTISSEADARSANCDYVLTSDFSKLKQSTSSKIGGMFGKVTGTDPNALRNYDVQVDFKLVSLADGKSVLQNKASNKGESDIDRAAESVLSQEATQILAVIK
ncbi:MAG TPA: hypothetical protein PKY59_24925 [Pyrinomonadaceae bacterium]|nr:hypothetical protein [Pyrinomonadaceae bacterium]